MGVETRGYNRWPRNWPENIPIWARYPEIMEGTSPWGYELIVESFFIGAFGILQPHVDALATFTNIDDGVVRWNVEPSIADINVGTILNRRIIRFADGHYAIFSFFTFFGLNQERWETGASTLEYSKNGDQNTLWSEKPIDIGYEDEEAQEASRYIANISIPTHCGQIWPPDD